MERTVLTTTVGTRILTLSSLFTSKIDDLINEVKALKKRIGSFASATIALLLYPLPVYPNEVPALTNHQNQKPTFPEVE
jgi:hypothetical protein